ncbi:hypothetical protein [Asticcacaulis sp.]|uniref:hypothetical protein n=1 Tax=Asticcacaulis sp. TaxID=1872648 RepID=UPI003F7C80B6
MTEGKCAIWGTDLIDQGRAGGSDNISFISPRSGGNYEIIWRLRNEISNLSYEEKLKLTTWLVNERLSGVVWPVIDYDVIEKIKNSHALTTNQRIDRFLLFCFYKKIRPGNAIYEFKKSQDGQSNKGLVSDEIYAWTESLNWSDFIGLRNIISEYGYIYEYSIFPNVAPQYDTISASGYMRIDALTEVNSNSNQAFVAMWFDPSLDASYENAIEPAIREAGYEPRIIRKVEHNNKIDDEIIAEIRRSKFVIADFTCGFSKDGSEAIARGGVYYEAGFAQGLGLPVIWTCHEDIISHVHFDTRQYNHIVWKDVADLKEKLLNRIRATIT